jgi:hypothetical protein
MVKHVELVNWSEHTGDCQVRLIHFYALDVDACHAEFRQQQIAVKSPPNENIMEDMRETTVVDPDGKQLRFITQLEKDRT